MFYNFSCPRYRDFIITIITAFSTLSRETFMGAYIDSYTDKQAVKHYIGISGVALATDICSFHKILNA